MNQFTGSLMIQENKCEGSGVEMKQAYMTNSSVGSQ